jgi:hypothetical protein
MVSILENCMAGEKRNKTATSNTQVALRYKHRSMTIPAARIPSCTFKRLALIERRGQIVHNKRENQSSPKSRWKRTSACAVSKRRFFSCREAKLSRCWSRIERRRARSASVGAAAPEAGGAVARVADALRMGLEGLTASTSSSVNMKRLCGQLRDGEMENQTSRGLRGRSFQQSREQHGKKLVFVFFSTPSCRLHGRFLARIGGRVKLGARQRGRTLARPDLRPALDVLRARGVRGGSPRRCALLLSRRHCSCLKNYSVCVAPQVSANFVLFKWSFKCHWCPCCGGGVLGVACVILVVCVWCFVVQAICVHLL